MKIYKGRVYGKTKRFLELLLIKYIENVVERESKESNDGNERNYC